MNMTIEDIIKEHLSKMEHPFTGMYDKNGYDKKNNCQCKNATSFVNTGCDKNCHFGYVAKYTGGSICHDDFIVYPTRDEALAADKEACMLDITKALVRISGKA